MSNVDPTPDWYLRRAAYLALQGVQVTLPPDDTPPNVHSLNLARTNRAGNRGNATRLGHAGATSVTAGKGPRRATTRPSNFRNKKRVGERTSSSITIIIVYLG
jgi:hypothetical protein